MAADGFTVNVAGVDAYSGKLSGDVALVSEVSGLVSQSDVGNESWGLVGLAVKSTYTSMLGDLNDLLGDMSAGLRAGAQKMTESAQAYREIDEAAAKVFTDGQNALGGN